MLVYFLVVYLQTIDRLLLLAIFLVYSGLLGLMVYYLEYPRNARVTKHFDDVTIFWSIENCSNKPLWLTHSESALNI